jgi:hypothetical protein
VPGTPKDQRGDDAELAGAAAPQCPEQLGVVLLVALDAATVRRPAVTASAHRGRILRALHCCLNLGFLHPGEAATAARLAAFHDLPTAYLNKQLQALARAGIVASPSGGRPGRRGPRRRRTWGQVVVSSITVAPASRLLDLLRSGREVADRLNHVRRVPNLAADRHRGPTPTA